MTKQSFDINQLRVASPCSVPWETMTGDERVRHCHSCKLNIYNISEMTEKEVKDLIVNREGRLCIRLYKRADGTVLTKDCPVGFRAYQKRIARFAGATLTAIFAFFSVSYGQKTKKLKVDCTKVSVSETGTQKEKGNLSGTVTDSSGAVVPNVELILRQVESDFVVCSRSDANGEFNFSNLSEGKYKLETKSKRFSTARYENISVISSKTTVLNIHLQPKGETLVVGIFAEEPLIDITSSGVTTTFTRKKIDTLPH